MKTLAIIAILGLHPFISPQCDRVDVLEVNKFYDEEGSITFTQLIGWDLSCTDGKYHVVFWRLMKPSSPASMYPTRKGRRFVSTWIDGEVLRTVSSYSRSFTHTQYDPEMRDRSCLPASRRRELCKSQ